MDAQDQRLILGSRAHSQNHDALLGVTGVILSKDYVCESRVYIAGLPLISSRPAAHGILLLGGRATGVLATGGIAMGGLSLGVFAVGGVSLGRLTFAILAFGWRAFSGLATGPAALGRLAVGKYAYRGNGVAYGSAEPTDARKNI